MVETDDNDNNGGDDKTKNSTKRQRLSLSNQIKSNQTCLFQTTRSISETIIIIML